GPARRRSRPRARRGEEQAPRRARSRGRRARGARAARWAGGVGSRARFLTRPIVQLTGREPSRSPRCRGPVLAQRAVRRESLVILRTQRKDGVLVGVRRRPPAIYVKPAGCSFAALSGVLPKGNLRHRLGV